MKTAVKKSSWKRIVIIGSIFIVVAAITVYVLASMQAWNAANTTTAQASTDLKQSVDSKLATETPPESTQVAIEQILKSYNDTLSKGPCELSALFEWQSNLPWLKDSRQECLNTAKSAAELATTLTTLQTFYKQTDAAALLLKQASESTATTKDYTAAALSWQKIAEDKSLSTKDAFEPVGAKIISISDAISSAYTALAAANGKEDKAAFDAAKQTLADAYAQLGDVHTASASAQAPLVDAVSKAYNNV